MDKNLSEILQVSKFSQNSGYSLIEIVVVIIILGILASVAVSSLSNVESIAKTEQTKRHLNDLSNAIAGNPDLITGGGRADYGYIGDIGNLPLSLDNLISNPGGFSTWNGPYLKDDFSSGSSDAEYDNDAWGKALVYSGVDITSNGSGSAITHKIANSIDDLLYNDVILVITDVDNNPPGADYKDSVVFLLSVPNGSGSIISKSSYPEADGLVEFDSIPIGIHTLKYIYLPDDDTLTRKVTVNTGQDYYTEVQYYNDVWGNTISGGGSTGGTGVETLRPNGEGDSDDFSSNGCSNNWQCVDETTNDGNSSYVIRTSSSYGRDSYETENYSSGTGVIDSLIIYISCNETNPSGRASTLIRTNGSNFYGSSQNPSSSYSEFSTVYTTNPSSSSAWTWTEINNIEIGVYARRARCTQVWVEVYYTY